MFSLSFFLTLHFDGPSLPSLLKVALLHGCFHAFKIAQMVPNRVSYHNSLYFSILIFK